LIAPGCSRRALAAIVVVAGAATVAGCGTRAVAGNRIAGTRLTIYASLPFRGASTISGTAVLRGAKLALDAGRDRVGRYHIVFRVLDDATVQRRGWDPGQTTANARLAARNPTTIGYIGEFNSGASAVSIPLLNRAGIPQISPSSTAVGLTTGGPEASPGEPQKYYPTGRRTYARVVPNDTVQAAAQAKLQRQAGCTKTLVLDDGEVDGSDMANSFAVAAKAAQLHVVAVESFQPTATDYSSLARSVAKTGADCVLISALTEENAVLVTKQIAAALPDARLFASGGAAESTYTDPADGGIPLALDPRVLITVATLDPSEYPPAGRRFFALYSERYGSPQPYAIFGYEAMSLMLDAISRATDRGTRPAIRSQVVAAIFATHDRHSVLGTYGIDRNGDTSLARYGVYRVRNGQLSFWKAMR
jgi:branched-chain amino acid transport system substrate-binding protein